MSEKEAIKEIENYLDYEGSVSIQAISILYTLYQKEKEKNKKYQGIEEGTTIIFKSKAKYVREDRIEKYYVNKNKIKTFMNENKILKDVFNQIRDLTLPCIVWYDYNFKNYNLKSCHKQQIYKNFSRIRNIVYAHYCNMDNDTALKTLINDKVEEKHNE